MGDVLSFPGRVPRAPACPELRAILEGAAQDALDIADRIIVLLDRMDGDPDREDDGDDEPSLGAPDGHERQVGWARGCDRDGEW